MQFFLKTISNFLEKRDKTSILVMAVFIVLAFGWLDYISGFEISFSFFYLIPIAIATWYISKNSGYWITFLSISTWLITNAEAGQKYSNELIRYWNASTRLTLFILIIWLLEEFKRALHHERLMAQTDHLTGIPNSREFYFQVNTELVRTSRFKQPLTIAYADVDSFKQVNDDFGHSEGDTILRTIAQFILTNIRKTDTVGRLGGDEFAILLPNTDQDGAKYILQKVQIKLTEEMNKTKSKVTFSIGVITFTSPPATVDELLHEADKLMYQVKATGKNGMVFIEV